MAMDGRGAHKQPQGPSLAPGVSWHQPVASARRSSLKRHAPALRASRWVASRPKGPRCPRHHCSTRPSESLSSSSSCTVGESATFSKAIFWGVSDLGANFSGVQILDLNRYNSIGSEKLLHLSLQD